MNAVNLYPKSPIEAFTWNFHYAWNAESAHPHVSVEHYLVKWSIENLRLLLLEEHKSVSSPEFILNSSNTTWCFEIYPNGLCNAAQSIDIIIKRLKVGPFSVGLTLRFGVLQTDGKTAWTEEKKVESFRNNSFRKISIQEPLQKELSEDKFKFGDVFTIVCEMYVTYTIPSVDSLDAADYDLVNFAFDLTKLMKAVEVTDLTLRFPGSCVRTHKAIMAARSTAVREALAKDGCIEEVQFNDISSDNFLQVLHFMYSGNVTSALKGEIPSIGLYECAQKLGVSDLTALLTPGHLHLRSILMSQEFSFTWTVRDFMKRSKSGTTCIKSQGFSGPSPDTPKWYLITNFDKDSDELGVFVETSGETKAAHSILKISLLDGNGDMTNTRLTTHFKKPGKRFGFPDFLSDFCNQNLKYELLVDDALRLHCELIFVVSEYMYESHDLSNNSISSPIDTYRTLSRDINQLLKTGAFSDVMVKAWDGSVFAAHRAVLFARSRKFYSKFLYYNRGEQNLEVMDMEPDLLKILIEHAYSGTFKPMTADAMLRVYKAAEAYVFRQLTYVTLHHVVSAIDAGNVFKLLEEGKKLRDQYLEEKCLAFVRKNWVKIVEFTDWEERRKENPDVFNMVVKQLNQVTIEH